jgi:adenylate cyclase
MALEIEHKFLVKGKDYQKLAKPTLYRQGYLSIDANKEIRVRMAGEKCFITVKSKINETMRHEFEYTIPAEDAKTMLNQLCKGLIVEKYRYCIPFKGMIWEVDEFCGDNAGLVIAEIELTTQGQPFEKPAWVGLEVSNDDHYLNAALALNPYKNWKK